MLVEYWESGDAPHEALGRAARRLASDGALYLGGGVGVERLASEQGSLTYRLTTAAGNAKGEEFPGPLSAAIRAFAKAGSSTSADSPGGSTKVKDPAAAARLRELDNEEGEARRSIARFERRVARKAARPQRVFSPGGVAVADEDNWEARRIDELRANLRDIASERSKLLGATKVEEVEQTRPGTNFTKIPAKNVAKLRPIIDHYKGKAKPFTECVADQVKHVLTRDHARRRCAVVKDLGQGSTAWHGRGKTKGKVAEGALVAAVGRIEAIEETLGVGMSVALIEIDPVRLTPDVAALAEGLALDYALLALSGHAFADMALEAFSAPIVSSEPKADAQRKVGSKAKKKTGSTGGSKYDESKHKRGSQGTSEGGRFISSGSSGEDVRAVQRKVGATTDGKFGSKTKQRVMDFQKRHGLKVDGIVGRQTSLAMRGHYATARKTQPGALHQVDSDALKAGRRGRKGRSGMKTGTARARGGMTV